MVLALTLVAFSSFAQKDSTRTNADSKPKKPFSDRIFIGGNVALSFNNFYFVIGASPIVGYRVTENWSVGVGASYYYYKDNYYNYSTSIYGGLLMSRYIVYRGLFVEGNFELNNQDALTIVDPIAQTYTLERAWIPSLLLGGGYSQSIGGNSAFFISILYDVIQNPNSQYYRIPVIRAGVGIGL